MRAAQNVTAFENNEKPVIDLLDRHLASAIDLQLRLRSALWNFKDPRLAETRELGTTASEIEQFCNLIAERLRALGAVAQATPQRVQVRSFLDPYPPAAAGDEDYISAIERKREPKMIAGQISNSILHWYDTSGELLRA